MLTSERLTRAKALLIADGWRINLLRDSPKTGRARRCALGAIYDGGEKVLTEQELWGTALYNCHGNVHAIEFLYAALPEPYRNEHPVWMQAGTCATYNNEQRDFSVISAWFDRAIELAETAEMNRELDQVKPAVEELVSA